MEITPQRGEHSEVKGLGVSMVVGTYLLELPRLAGSNAPTQSVDINNAANTLTLIASPEGALQGSDVQGAGLQSVLYHQSKVFKCSPQVLLLQLRPCQHCLATVFWQLSHDSCLLISSKPCRPFSVPSAHSKHPPRLQFARAPAPSPGSRARPPFRATWAQGGP